MIRATSPKIVAVLPASILGSDGAATQSMPDKENGRYALSPASDGVVRFDTRTGAVSTCSHRGAGRACYSIPDERAALDAEIGRLQTENDKVRAELEKLKARLGAGAPADGQSGGGLAKVALAERQ